MYCFLVGALLLLLRSGGWLYAGFLLSAGTTWLGVERTIGVSFTVVAANSGSVGESILAVLLGSCFSLVSEPSRLTMEITRLSKDELLHEVGVRGRKLLAGKTTVKELRALLLQLREAESGGDEMEDVLLPVDVEEEVSIIEAKLDEAKDLLEALLAGEEGAGKSLGNAIRVRTIASHCNKRLVRLLSHAGEDKKEPVKSLLVALKGIVDEFRKLGKAPVYAATTVMTVTKPSSKSKKTSVSGESDAEEDKDLGAKPKTRHNAKLDLHKWGIKFSGEEGISVLSFIMDVEEKATWKQVDFNLLVAGVSEFFTDQAKTWYRSVKDKIDSWNELKIALRREYLPLDYYDNLWEEIRARKQGPIEPIGTYIANMIALFSRLEMVEPVDQVLMLNIIMKNLAPFYAEHLALTPVLSIDQLKILGKKLEVSKARVDSYEGKMKGRKMEPEFAVKSARPKKPVLNEVSVEATPPLKKEEGEPSKPGGKPKAPEGRNSYPILKCWKCDEVGHRHTNCTSQVNRRFCFKCGMKDVTVRNCSRCRRKGEEE